MASVRQLRQWPTLYKKSPANGKISVWKIWVEGSVIHTESGYQGQKMKPSRDPIKSGKNIGRKNETTAEEQAEFEAKSKYQKYLDKGYSPDLKKTQTKKGAARRAPMLAHDYTKHGHRLSFPVYAQPKLDGMRLNKYEGEDFVSRNGKPIAKLPALNELADEIRSRAGYELDGEAYNHEYRHGFSKIISGAKTIKGNNKEEDKIQYHIYDLMAPDLTFEERLEVLKDILPQGHYKGRIVLVETLRIDSEEELKAYHKANLKDGYEGTMIRDPRGLYEIDKRSYTLQKYKPYEDSEFKIVGVVEGRGQLKGSVGAFVLEINDERGRRTFESKLTGQGVNKFLKKAWEDHSLWKGKWMHVRFRGYTDKEFVPRENRSIKIREVE